MESFNERLIELMTNIPIADDQLGKVIGVDGSAVHLWRTSKTDISLSNAIRVAEYFKCSLEFLFGRVDTQLDFTPKPALPFYERLTSIMVAKKISRYRLCKDLKKGHGHFDRWKSGVDPRMNTVIELADYLKVTLDELVGLE